MRACSTHRRAPRARLKFPLPRTHARMFGLQARTYARLSPNRPCMWAPHPLKNPNYPCTALRTNPAQKLKTYFYAG
jgi:hypothetical protein